MNLLENVKLIKSPTNENNYLFVFPDKSRKPASMTDVLLWELHKDLDNLTYSVDNVQLEVRKGR